MFQMYEVVKLKKDMPLQGLYAGTHGTIVMIFDEPSLPRAYEVEFFDKDSITVAVLTIKEEHLEGVSNIEH